MPIESKYPEHDKLAAVKIGSDIIHDFLQFLETQGITLKCETQPGKHMIVSRLVAEFYGVDIQKLMDEKESMFPTNHREESTTRQ